MIKYLILLLVAVCYVFAADYELRAADVNATTTIVLAQSQRVVKQTVCPREIKVSSARNTGDWEVPLAQAKYSRVKVATRTMGKQKVYTAVCYYKAFMGEVPIEQVLGDQSRFSRCEKATINGRGGVKCFGR